MREEFGVRWNEKWIYLGEDGKRVERVVLWNRYDLAGAFRVLPDGTRRAARAARRVSDPGGAAARAAGARRRCAPSASCCTTTGSWTHEGVRDPRIAGCAPPSTAASATCADEGVFVVQLGRFRGQIEVEEAAFFVRGFDAASGALALSDGERASRSIPRRCASRRATARCCAA